MNSSEFKDNCCTEMCTDSEAGSFLRLKDIVSLNSRLESNKEEEEEEEEEEEGLPRQRRGVRAEIRRASPLPSKDGTLEKVLETFT